MPAEELIADIETTDEYDAEVGAREWTTVSRHNQGWVSIRRDVQRSGGERRTDPEAGICIDDACVAALILALRASQRQGKEP